MHRYLSALVLSAALLTPVAITAAKDDDDHRHRVKRYYDKDNRDYHEWNEREDSAYRRYLQEQHRENRDWAKANRKQQREYWKWRHEHRDDDHR